MGPERLSANQGNLSHIIRVPYCLMRRWSGKQCDLNCPQYLLTSKLNCIRDAIVSVIRGSQERLACSKAIKSHYRFATAKRVINRCHGEKVGTMLGRGVVLLGTVPAAAYWSARGWYRNKTWTWPLTLTRAGQGLTWPQSGEWGYCCTSICCQPLLNIQSLTSISRWLSLASLVE